MVRRSLIAIFTSLGFAACQHSAGAVPAILTDDAPENMAALKRGLGEAMGRTEIKLGAGDPTQISSVSVLPLPLHSSDDRSLARPTFFDLVVLDDACIAVHAQTRIETRLPGVSCKPL